MLRNLMIDAIADRAARPARIASNRNVVTVTITTRLRRKLRQMEMRRQLMALDDRMLADIGIARHEIDGIVSQAVMREFPQVKPLLRPLADGLKAAWTAWQESARQRAASRSLRSLDDHLLRDVGLRREAVATLEAAQTRHQGVMAAAWHAAGTALRSWRDYHRTARTLAALDDRTLHDIGIVRSEIARTALKVAHTSVANDDYSPVRRKPIGA